MKMDSTCVSVRALHMACVCKNGAGVYSRKWHTLFPQKFTPFIIITKILLVSGLSYFFTIFSQKVFDIDKEIYDCRARMRQRRLLVMYKLITGIKTV